VGDLDGPLGVVDQVVVMPAEQHQVLQAGLAAVGPVLDVVQCRSVKRGRGLAPKDFASHLDVHVEWVFAVACR
jgi:hypothetical protein